MGMTYRKKSERQVKREARQRRERATSAYLRKLLRLNPGIGKMQAQEVLSILEAYRDDLVAGKNPVPPFKGLL